MFSWLTNLFRAAPPEAPRVRTARTEPQASAARAPHRDHGPTYLELLRAEASLPYPLTPEEHVLVPELVKKVRDYVADRKLDPPTMPALAPRVLDTLRDPKLDVARLSRTLEQDQAISAKLLTIANSAMFSPGKEVTSLRDAITLLGIDQVAQIAIGLATRSLFDANAKAELAVDRKRWNRQFSHGMVTAFATANLYAEHRRRPSDEAFLSGLFHDVGKAVALRAIAAMSVAGEWPSVNEDVLDEVLHEVHAQADSEFYARWAFPSQLMQVCSSHHQFQAAEDAPEIVHWVCVVSSLDALRAGTPCSQREALLELPVSVARLGLTDAQLRAAHTQTKVFAERVQRLFAG